MNFEQGIDAIGKSVYYELAINRNLDGVVRDANGEVILLDRRQVAQMTPGRDQLFVRNFTGEVIALPPESGLTLSRAHVEDAVAFILSGLPDAES